MAHTDASRAAVEAAQWAQLQGLWTTTAASNSFYQTKFRAANLTAAPGSLADFQSRVPFTTKAELVSDQAVHPPYGTDLSFPVKRYIRCHQTSGTSGKPLRWLDTAESWAAMVEDWTEVFRAAGVGVGDRILFAFSFGPFLGFWLAFEAGQQLGALCFAGGGMSSAVRLRVLLENECTVLCCTPTYALHLATTAREGIGLAASRVRTIVVAGEPGGSLPATRSRLSAAWNGARVFDHHGMTETGPVTYEVPDEPGNLQVLERSFLAEIVDPISGKPVGDGVTGELVLTTLRRLGSPLIRYRTGDLVQQEKGRGLATEDGNPPPPVHRLPPSALGPPPTRLRLRGGILGRVDDMVIVRGVNVYPTAIEELVRSVPELGEYRVWLDTRGALSELALEVEGPAAAAAELSRRLHDALALRIPVHTVSAGSLPRFEMKARRWQKL